MRNVDYRASQKLWQRLSSFFYRRSNHHSSFLISHSSFTILLFSLLITNCTSHQAPEREWQALNDTIADCSRKIQNIVGIIQSSPTTTAATQERLLHDIDSIDRRMKDAIRRCAERNKDNELGRYIQENYTEE